MCDVVEVIWLDRYRAAGMDDDEFYAMLNAPFAVVPSGDAVLRAALGV